MSGVIINEKVLDESSPAYFIADIASNHDGSLTRAKELIHMAAEAGANAAKFQNFKAPKIVSRKGFDNMGQLSHQKSWKKSVYEVYEDASIPEDWTRELYEECKKYNIDYATSPYDFQSVEAAAPYTSFFKIGSGDITWPEIGMKMAEYGKPVFVSTGAADLEDARRMMDILQPRAASLVLMQCNTNYTGSRDNFKYVNLNVLKTFRELWPDILLGLSDHTPGDTAVLGAVALGAKVIEKHFTDSNLRDGPDHAFSLTPETWKTMVSRVRELEDALGDGVKRVEPNEETTVVIQRRGLYATHDLPAGHVLTAEDLKPLRPAPANGFPPYEQARLIGGKLKNPLKSGDLLKREDID